MKTFQPLSHSIEECKAQFIELEKLLKSKQELEEGKDILPFFRENLHLAALIGMYAYIISPDRIATEYDIFGDFVCDLAIGNSQSKTYLFVEFEDAKLNSLFKNTKKSTPEWSSRFEHGFSQIVDWFWKFSDMEKSDEYEHRFGAKQVDIHGLLVIGRDQNLDEREKRRLKWRQYHTIVNSKKISVITFDNLVTDLKFRLQIYPKAAISDNS